MSDTPEAPRPFPQERLRLPGPRGVWWVLAALTVCIPLATHVLSAPEAEDAGPEALQAELRGRTFIWRVMGETPGAGRASSLPTKAPLGEAVNASDDVTRVIAEAQDRDWAQLQDQAEKLDLGETPAVTSAREDVIVHALAVGEEERAVALAQAITGESQARVSTDLRALLVGLPDVPTALALDPTTTHARLEDRHFGQGWSPYQRDHARVGAYERLGDLPTVRRLVKQLEAQDHWVIPAWTTVAVLFLTALITGLAFWLTALLRSVADRAADRPAWLWVRERYSGLPHDLPYPTDPLLAPLGFGGWLSAYLLAGLGLALQAGKRPMSGLGVLFESGVGVLAGVALIQTFARQSPGLLWAARLPLQDPQPDEPQPPALFASLVAAVRVLTALMPVMALVVLGMALLGVESANHPVAGMMLGDTDPISLGAIGIAVTLLAPLGEELVFRGFVYRALRMRWGVLPAALVTSLAFSALHPSLAPYMTLSVAFCLAYEWSGSLWTSILLHATWNTLSYVMLVGFALS